MAGGSGAGRLTRSAEFLSSTDERFRPVNLSSAPDGTLYVVDMYRGIIQHMAYMTEYLRDNISERQLEAPVAQGPHFPDRPRDDETGSDPSLATESAARLAERLSHPNGWWSDAAQRILSSAGTNQRFRGSGAGPDRARSRAPPCAVDARRP